MSPSRGSARKMQRALLAARENGDSDEEGHNRSGAVAPVKSLTFNVSSTVEGQRHTSRSKPKSGSPTRLPKSLLRSPGKPRAVAEPVPEKANSEIESLPQHITTNSVLPRCRSPPPDHSMPGALADRNPFVSLAQTSRAPLAVLEEHPGENPTAKAAAAEDDTPLPSSPMKIDCFSLEEPSVGVPEESAEDQGAPPPISTAVQVAAEIVAPPLNAHIDVVVPLNNGDGTSRQSHFKAASQPARQSGGAGLRRSTFARSFAPRSRVVSSSAGDTAAAAAAMEVVDVSSATAAASNVAPQSAQSAKRKSDALEVGNESAPDMDRKIWKVEQNPLLDPLETEIAVGMPSQNRISIDAAAFVNSASSVTEIGAPAEPGAIAVPPESEADVSSKTPLAQLAALAQGLTTGSRKTTSGIATEESTSEPLRAPSLYPNTRTFDLRELMGANYESPASPKFGSERNRSESPDFSDNITPDGGDIVGYPAAEDVLSDGDEADHDAGGPFNDDMAVAFVKESFTPVNSPPKSAMRTGYSVPQAMPEVNNELQSQINSTSASSILSVAKAVVTNFFRPAARQSGAFVPVAVQIPAPQSAAIPSVTDAPRLVAFNPFTMDLPEPHPMIGVNPFLPSPAKPLPPPPSEESQSSQQASQSTAFSSQLTGASFFDSQPFMRRASYENPGYESDITESQYSQSQFEKSIRSAEVEDERQDVDEVTAALAGASTNTGIQFRCSAAEGDEETPPATGVSYST